MLKMWSMVIIMIVLLLGCDKKPDIQSPKTKQVNLEQKEERVKLKKVHVVGNPKQYKVNMYFISQGGCGACEKVNAYMQKPEIKALLEKEFIVTEVDINFKEELPFAWMKPFATPTLYFFEPNGDEIVDPIVKRLSEKEFVAILKNVIEIRDMD
jgi:thioredoxin-related protein